MGNYILRTSFNVKKSKAKVTRPTNTETESVSYLPNVKTHELQTWYTDVAQRPASPTSTMTSMVKGQGRDVTWCVLQVLAHKSRMTPNTKICRKVAQPTGNVKRSKVKVTRQMPEFSMQE